MARSKKPAHIARKDWDSVNSSSLSEDILSALRPAGEAFPTLVNESLKRKRIERGPQKKPRKVVISLRLESSRVAAYKAGGKDYQDRMAAVLEKYAK